MFPYHDENETQRPAYVTMVFVAINVFVWVVVQGAGSALPLATSVCNLGLIPAELTGALPPGARIPDGRRARLPDRSRAVSPSTS